MSKIIIILILFVFSGCSGMRGIQRASIMHDDEIVHLLESVFDEDFPVPIINPFEINEEMKIFVDNVIRAYHNNERAFNAIVDAIFHGKDPMVYNEAITNTAINTFASREGNCLSLTNMFIALSRYANLNTFFLEVHDHIAWTSQGDLIINNRHIIAGMHIYRVRMRGGLPSGYITVDFYPSRPKAYRHLEPIDDIKAIVYYYNNLGVGLIRDNRLDDAEILFTNLLRLDVAKDKIYNNLGAAYSKRREFEKAFLTYEKGLKYNNKNQSILSNLVMLSNYLQKTEAYIKYKTALERTRNTNPYFFIQMANHYFLQNDSTNFLESINRAKRLDPTIPDIYLLLVKHYLRSRDFDLASQNLEKAEALQIDQETSRLFHNKIDYFVPR